MFWGFGFFFSEEEDNRWVFGNEWEEEEDSAGYGCAHAIKMKSKVSQYLYCMYSVITQPVEKRKEKEREKRVALNLTKQVVFFFGRVCLVLKKIFC